MIHLLFFLQITFAGNSDIGCRCAFCSSCGSGNICTECIDGYVLNENNECVFFEDAHCDSNSKTYYEKCFSCASGYVLTSEHNCIDCSSQHPDCTIIDGIDCSANCTECGDYTYLNSDNNCQNDDIHCAHYSSDGICSYCSNFYYLDDDKKCQKGAIDNCQVYTSETECYGCLNDLLTNLNNSACGECSVEHCTRCASNFDLCDSCETGYILNSDNTECQQCSVSNCRICVDYNTTECQYCDSGYYRSSDKTQCDACIENCNTCESITTCLVCNNGYYPSPNKTECIYCPDNCARCHKDDSDNLFCDMCSYKVVNKYYKGDYTLNDDSTACVSNIPNCAVYNAGAINTCLSCDSKYTIENNVCNPCKVNGCTECTNSTDYVCDTCEDGYRVMTVKGVSSCVAKIGNCTTHTLDYDNCTTCKTNYYPIEDGTACRTCITSDNHCTACSDAYTCTDCDAYYYLNSDNTTCETCINDSNHCSSCEDTNTCTYCEYGYVIDNGECKACPSHCSVCNKDDLTKCVKCDDGYFMTEGYKCSACSSECQEDVLTYASTDDDYICNDAEYTCFVHQENHCKRLSSDGSECIECESPYTLDEGKCYAYKVGSVGYDGKAYVCLQYPEGTDEYDEESKLTEVYEPEDGECRNKFISKDEDGSFSVAIIAIISFIVLIL
ncbi:hypothetical protein QTN25_005663 [Entamoeba marina]